MLFNSIQFLVFFLLVAVIYFLLPHRFRWIHLLGASCIFYCAFIPVYILVLFFLILIDYFAGLFIEQAMGRRRKLFLLVSLVANLSVLAVFKYADFFIDNINALLTFLNLTSHPVRYIGLILPIGLSFHTFQAMSYTIEVYRGHRKAERHLGIYSLYVMFFPQLVAGPIERPGNLLHQFYEEKKFEVDRVIVGAQQMLWGLFKKVVVADQLSIYVDSIYDHWEINKGLTVVVATWAFAFQIYCDFSGYSDIAQGAARVLGFKLMDNFSFPYYSKSITEFWRRWHISLSTWLRDYLYIPLGGNRGGNALTYRNLMITMLLGGFWHGASWNFVIWGFLHGIFLCGERLFPPAGSAGQNPVIHGLRILITFNLVCIAWVFFRSSTVAQSLGMLSSVLDFHGFLNFRFQDVGVSLGLALALFLILESAMIRGHDFGEFSPSRGWLKPMSFMLGMTFLIVLFGVADGDQFIYFQF